MEGDDSCHGVVDCVSAGKGIRHVAVHVEVDAVATDDPRLAASREFCVADVPDEAVLGAACHHQMGAVAFGHRAVVAHHFDVPGQETDLSPHLNFVASVGLYSCEVQIFEGLIDGDGCAVDGDDVPAFCFVVVEAGRRHDYGLADSPVDCVLEFKRALSDPDRGAEHAPGELPYLAVEGDEALHAADALVAEHGLLRTVVVSRKNEGQLVVIGFLLGAREELSSDNGDESNGNDHV